jgi:NADPH:quinone reductase-like Zn-dependent oxidoreductase
MLAVTATSLHPDRPLDGLTVGEVPDPTPAPGWVKVKVTAASLNHHDLWTLKGVGMTPDRLPMVLGCDAAGTTEDGTPVVLHSVVTEDQVPDGVKAPDFSILSEVFDGTLAQWVCVPRRNVLALPEGLSAVEAACLPTAWLTAYRMLFVRGGLRPGQRVLVQGAGGGVATALVSLAAAAGLHVTVTSRDASKLERARELGAHVALESGARLPHRVHAVMETVGEATWDHSLKSLESDGVIVVAGATSGAAPSADLQRVFYRQLRVIGSTMGTQDELRDLIGMCHATGVRPVVDSVMPLADARTAFERLADGDVFGKLVLQP